MPCSRSSRFYENKKYIATIRLNVNEALAHQTTKFKRRWFCGHDDCRGFTWLTLQSITATKISWRVVHRNFEKCNKNLRIFRCFPFSVSFNFLCNLTGCRLADSDITFIYMAFEIKYKQHPPPKKKRKILGSPIKRSTLSSAFSPCSC